MVNSSTTLTYNTTVIAPFIYFVAIRDFDATRSSNTSNFSIGITYISNTTTQIRFGCWANLGTVLRRMGISLFVYHSNTLAYPSFYAYSHYFNTTNSYSTQLINIQNILGTAWRYGY